MCQNYSAVHQTLNIDILQHLGDVVSILLKSLLMMMTMMTMMMMMMMIMMMMMMMMTTIMTHDDAVRQCGLWPQKVMYSSILTAPTPHKGCRR